MMQNIKKTILLVEDEVILALGGKKNLTGLGYDVILAHNGEAAIRLFSENPSIDLVLMDIDLGSGMDGVETASLMLQQRELPVVFHSGHVEPEIVARTEAVTSYGYVVKGSGTTVLDASIKMAFKLFAAQGDIQRAENELRKTSRYYQAIIENAPEGIVVLSPAGQITFASKAAREAFGFSHIDPTTVRPDDFTHPEDLPMVHKALVQIMDDPSYVPTLTYRFSTKGGDWRWVESTFTNLCADPDVASIVINFRDVTDRKLYEDQLEFLSGHDTGTGLYNRAYFNQFLDKLDIGVNLPISMISADVDGLKLVNDTFGSKFSEEMLREFAEIFRMFLRPGDLLARIGGDEFAFVLPRSDSEVAEALVENIQNELQKRNSDSKTISMSISFGVYTLEKEGLPLDRAFKLADDYMYLSKLNKGSSPKSNIISTLMATLSQRDYITEGHSQRLAELGSAIGKALHMSSRQLDNLALLSQVHDIGKVGIPDTILLKPGKLTPEEWRLMKQHTVKGYIIATASPELSGVAELVLRHHERWDGQGYPLGLHGPGIPLECRVLSVVDSFDAMTNDRPYSKARSKEDALAEIIACSGTQFDPEVVKIFAGMM